MQKDKEVVASYSYIFYYFSMELFLLVSGSVQAPHPVVLVQEERFPVSMRFSAVLAHCQVCLPDSGSKLVANPEVATEDCGYTACRRGKQRPGLWSSTCGCTQHVGSFLFCE